MLTTAHGQPVVIDGGKAGILIELNAQTGKLLWKLPVGVHSGHDNDGLLTENATPSSAIPLPATFDLEPGVSPTNVVFTTTYHGDLYAFNAATGAVLLKTPLSAGTNAPVAIDGDYVIAGAANALSSGQRPLIIAYKLGAKGKLPDTVR